MIQIQARLDSNTDQAWPVTPMVRFFKSTVPSLLAWQTRNTRDLASFIHPSIRVRVESRAQETMTALTIAAASSSTEEKISGGLETTQTPSDAVDSGASADAGAVSGATSSDGRGKRSKGRSKKTKEQIVAWKKASDDFTGALLDESFLHLPVRGTTVKAADLYPSSYPDEPALMPGSHKHLGGAYDPTDGCIYGVPANSKSILCIYPTNHGKDGAIKYKLKTIPLPKRIVDRRFKWLRGILAHGYLWAIPSWADSVLCVDVDAFWGRRELAEGQTDVVQLLPLPESHSKDMTWQWHGASMNKEQTAIYCIPSNAQKVLKVDVATKTTSFIEIDFEPEIYKDFALTVTNKWYGGIRGDDNAVYGIPYRAAGILRIDSITDTAKLIGPNYGVAKYNWHGGIMLNGKIYAHPSHADTVLVIDTREDSKGKSYELPIHRRDSNNSTESRNTYKWLGGGVGADGNIYCPACDTDAFLKIDVTADFCETFGSISPGKNKFQGACRGRDGCIYSIPTDSEFLCRIATNPEIEGEPPVQIIGGLPPHPDKWQGAAQGKDGALYFIPENGYRVLRVLPPATPPIIVDGKLPEGDVLVELM